MKNKMNMNMKNLSVIILGIIAISIASCTKPIAITIPQAPAKLCIASQVIPDQFILVTVTKSFTSLYSTKYDTSANINFDIFVNHALVTVSYNNKIDTLFPITSGVYSSFNTLIASGTTYTLNVYDSTTKESVSAITAMEKPTSLQDLKVIPIQTITDTSIDTSYNFKYSFNDADPSVDNYYFVSISKANPGSLVSNPSTIFNLLSSSNILKLYSDAQANNNLISDSLKGIELLNGFKPADTVLFMVSSISKDYFKYLTAFKKSNSIINQLTGEPINYPTNIKNGYGFFSAHSPKLKIIVLRNP
jgi:hypothetical protein